MSRPGFTPGKDREVIPRSSVFLELYRSPRVLVFMVRACPGRFITVPFLAFAAVRPPL